MRQGFPFSTYGEGVFILVQNVVICVLVLRYGGRQAAAAAFVGGLAVAAAGLFVEGVRVDMGVLSMLQIGAGVVGCASKVPQIAAIWQEGGTGQLSAFAVSGDFFLDVGFFESCFWVGCLVWIADSLLDYLVRVGSPIPSKSLTLICFNNILPLSTHANHHISSRSSTTSPAL